MTINEILDLAIAQGLLTEERKAVLSSLQDIVKTIIDGEGTDIEKAANIIGVSQEAILQFIENNS